MTAQVKRTQDDGLKLDKVMLWIHSRDFRRGWFLDVMVIGSIVLVSKSTILDSSGWLIELPFEDLELKVVDPDISELRTDDDWIAIHIRAGPLCLACEPLNLREGLDRFLDVLAASEPE